MKPFMVICTVLVGLGLGQELKDPLPDIDGELGRTGAYVRCFDERLEWNFTPQERSETNSKTGISSKQTLPSTSLNSKTSSQTRCVVAYRSTYSWLVLLLGIILLVVGLGLTIWQIRSSLRERRELQDRVLEKLFGAREKRTLESALEGAREVLGLIGQITEALSKLVQSVASIPGAAGIVLVGLGGWLILTALDQEFQLFVINAASIPGELSPSPAASPAK